VLRIRITFDADAYPDLPFDADPDPNFHFHVDPDPAPHQIYANLRLLAYIPSMAPF
jgi:hypothetical protein